MILNLAIVAHLEVVLSHVQTGDHGVEAAWIGTCKCTTNVWKITKVVTTLPAVSTVVALA